MMTQAPATNRPSGSGWERIVERINEASDEPSFLAAMLQLQCMIVAADYGAIWLTDDRGELHLGETWPTTLKEHDPNSAVVQMLREAATAGLARGNSHTLKLHIGDEVPSPDTQPKSLVHITPMRSHGKIAAVCTAVAETSDPKVAKITAPMRELAAGLYEGFESRLDAHDSRLDAQGVRSAMALLAVSQEGRGFNGAALNLVNELARQQQCSRVCLGWVKGKSIRVVAMSDTEHLKRHHEQVTRSEMAMSECLDQQQPIVYPVWEDAEPLLAQAVVHAHRRLTGDHPSKHVLSIPLRDGDEWVGVLLLERSDVPFDDDLIRSLQLVADVIAPHLVDRRSSDRFLFVHAWHSLIDGTGYVLGPKHIGWKLVAILVMAVLGVAVFGTWPYHVSAPFTLEAQDKRIVPAPYEGRLDLVKVEPGFVVLKGQLLAQFDTTDLKLQLAETTAEEKKITFEKNQATAENKLAEAQQAQAQLEQIQSRIKLLQYHIEKASIRAPIAGVVLSGYWHDKVGGVLEQGKPMFEISSIKQLLAIVRVEESDIDLIDLDLRQDGQLATRSVPEEKFDIIVSRIVPMATPIEGTNVFEVRCEIKDPAKWLRPGMEGLARVNVGDRRIIWILTHRIINTVRLWLWL